ncbi:MAG: HpcH/HpaI aldolase/citrate lyase family protein [Bacillota bacterium]|jgi:citrate lyase subunit beta/citryl-CoA lyase
MLLRTILFIPGNSPRMMVNADILSADLIVLDLEDAIPLSQKDAARIMVKNFLKTGYCTCPVAVRINDINTEFYRKDIEMIVPLIRNGLMVPKVNSANDMAFIDASLCEIEKNNGLEEGSTGLYVILETALGVENAFSIANSSRRIISICFGGEDYAADIGAKRTLAGEEIKYSRQRVVNAAKAAGINATDTVFTDVDNIKGLVLDATFARDLGYDGKSVISPRHIETVNTVFSPTIQEISYALRVVAAMEAAEKEGIGAVSLDGKMLDIPVLARAEKLLTAAWRAGCISALPEFQQKALSDFIAKKRSAIQTHSV